MNQEQNNKSFENNNQSIKCDAPETKSTTNADASKLSGLTESATEAAKGTYDQAKNIVGQAYGVATKRAAEAIDDQKATLTGGLASVADTIKQVGDNLNSNAEPNVITETAAKYTNSLAAQIEGVSDYFERKDIREIVGDVENFARKYPAYFVGGALALGFLAARFLKSSPPKKLSKAAGKSFGGNAANPS